MQLKKPKFWDSNKKSIFSTILFPFSLLVLLISKFKRLKKGKNFTFPIICVGNIYLGGTGKTPISIEIFKIIKSMNKKPVFIKKLYSYIYDEINILKNIGPVISHKNRIKSLSGIENLNYDIALLDDGFQDTSIRKDLSILCFGENTWIGNGKILPSGPLREPLSSVKYADFIMIKGDKNQEKENQLLKYNKKLQFFYFNYDFKIENTIKEKKIVAFAGIGDPKNFFELLTNKKINIVKTFSFPDHYEFKSKDLDMIIKFSKNANATILTTEKDYERIDIKYKPLIHFVKLEVKIDKYSDLKNLIKNKI